MLLLAKSAKFEVYLKWNWLNQNIQQIPRDTDAEQQWQSSSCHSRHSKSSGSKWLKGFKRIRKDCQARQISGPVPEGLRHAWLQLISNTVIFPGQPAFVQGIDCNCCLLPQHCGLHEDISGSNKGSALPSSSLQQSHIHCKLRNEWTLTTYPHIHYLSILLFSTEQVF